MFKVFLLQSLAWLYDALLSLLLQAVAQVSLFKYLFYCKGAFTAVYSTFFFQCDLGLFY